MPHYQQLLFGCARVRAGLADRNTMSEIEMVWDWIGNLAERTGIVLDWIADTVIIAPLESDQPHKDDILGVVVAISHPQARQFTHSVALLGDLLPKEAGPTALVELCLPLSADIQTAMMKWEIVRFSARGIGLDLPPGRLYLVEGLFDTAGTVELGGAAEDALTLAQDCDM